MKSITTAILLGMLGITTTQGYVDYPQQVGDLLYRESGHSIYGRDGDTCWMAMNSPGHVGIYVGGGNVVHALGWDIVFGEVVETPIAASSGVRSFYEDDSKDGVEDHGHMGAKTHVNLLNNPNATTLRQHIVYLARDQVGEGYDNNLWTQKGQNSGDWTCCGLTEKVYESCAGQTLIYPSTYGDQQPYAGGLNITPDGYEYHFNDLVCYYQANVEFSQLATAVAVVGRYFGLLRYVFFPYTQFQQSSLTDSVSRSWIGSLSDSPDPVTQNGTLYLVANDVFHPDGKTITQVAFYRDINGNGVLDIGTDQLLGADTSSSGGWWWVGTASFSTGTQRYFARAQASDGSWSTTVSTLGQVQASAAQPGSWLSIDGYDWNADENGDKDGVIETGEDVEMRVRLRSSANIDSFFATLSSSCGNLNISDNEEQYPAILAGNTAWPYGSGFNMYLDMASTYNVPFSLYVTYTKDGQDYYQTLPFSKTFYENGSRNAAFQVVSYTIDDSVAQAPYNNGDGVIQSGEHVEIRPKLKNTGQAGATDIEAWLSYTGTAFSVDGVSSKESYPDLSPNQEEYPTSGGDFDIRDIRRDYSGTEYIDFHLTYDQSPTEVVLAGAIEVIIQPAAWMRLSEKTFDFGIASPGSTVTHTTLVQNVGSAPLQITNVTTSAGDTTWGGFTLPCTLAAGQSTNLIVQINTTGLQGQISRQIQAFSTGRVGTLGKDDVLIMSGLVSGTVPISQIPNVTGANVPDISGDWIVWVDGRNGNSDIYGYNLATGEEKPICTNSTSQWQPRIWGNLIVWQDKRNAPTSNYYDIYAYDLSRPDLGEFPCLLSSGHSSLIGVDSNMVAVASDYYTFTELSNWDTARNLFVYRYQGSGQFTQIFYSGFTSNSSHNPMQSIENGGDFAQGLLVVERHEIWWDTAPINDYWDSRNQRLQTINFAAGESSLSDAGTGWHSWPCAERDRFVYCDTINSYDQIFLRRVNGAVSQLTTNKKDHAQDVLGIGGPDGSDCVVYDYRSSSLPGLYYLDRTNNQEYLISTAVDPWDLRMDNLRVVFIDGNAASAVKYVFLKQADVQVTSPGITFSQENPVEGTPLHISVLVRNLTTYNQTGNVTVNLYDGDPDSGGVSLATGQTFSGLASNTDRSVTFSNITSLVEGQHNIFAKLTVSTSDPANNNKASRTIVLQDSDTQAPTISNALASERNGDGDGIIGSDENIRISWNASDATGIGAMSLTVDGANATVQGSYYTDIGPLATGIHTVTVTAVDSDISSETRQHSFNFSVVAKESISVSFNGSALSNGSPAAIDLGAFSKDVSPSHPLFIVQNNGEQQLVLQALTLTGPLTKSGPGTTNIAPSSLTWFDLVPNTGTEGVFTGTVAVVNSDTSQSPFNFQARFEVRADTDSDTIPDAWELTYFPDLTKVTATSDSDGDGSSDRDEYFAGTDPTKASSRFAMKSVEAVPGGFAVGWSSVPGKTYKVLYSDSPGGPWQEDLPDSQITAVTGQTTLSYTDTTAGSTARRFYRIKLVTP